MTPTNPPSTTTTPIKALDSLMRRELNIADPNDANEVAQALLKRYSQDARAMALEREAAGLPGFALPQQPARPTAATPAGELEQVTGDVEKDLNTLRSASVLKHIQPELEGWSEAIHTIIADGSGAAALALDRHQRDRAMAARRRLGDYSRAARLVGMLTPHVNQEFRALARSMDSVANVWLVVMGEALAEFPSFGGQFLLSVPVAELQVRKQAVLNSLRTLVGATGEALDGDDWPRGLDAYIHATTVLDEQRRNDLRALFVESELERTIDALIQRAGSGASRSLRSLGATAQLEVERFRNLVDVLRAAAVPESPPLAAFLDALLLFAQAFDPAGGERLARIARPAILTYGTARPVGPSPAEIRLTRMIDDRAQLAAFADCVLDCGCSLDLQRGEGLVDLALYCLDRAIDLYAQGSDDFGIPEQRASAFSMVIEAMIPVAQPRLPNFAARIEPTLQRLIGVQGLRPAGYNAANPQQRQHRQGELMALWAQECNAGAPLPRLVQVMVDDCVPLAQFWQNPVIPAVPAAPPVPAVPAVPLGDLIVVLRDALIANGVPAPVPLLPRRPISIPADTRTLLEDLLYQYGRDGSGRP